MHNLVIKPILWKEVLKRAINFLVQTKVLPSKGNLAWEYNPLRNYRLQHAMYEYKNSLYSLGDLANNFKITPNISIDYYEDKEHNINYFNTVKANLKIFLSFDQSKIRHINSGSQELLDIIKKTYQEGRNLDRLNFENVLKLTEIKSWNGVPLNESSPTLREKGELVDFITDELNFKLNHPVNIIPLYSYDGSVNLILNDGINAPRMINTRFSATGKDTYEIIDRKGNNDTNIYDQGEQFDIDTSLYKKIIKIPKLKFVDTLSGGDLKVGNYTFYFKYCDADGNETDFVAESGMVHVFIGDHTPNAIYTGERNENSFKGVEFILSDIDASYDYVTVYYSRSTSEDDKLANTEYFRIDKRYLVNNADVCDIVINGFEEKTPVNRSDINLRYNFVDSAKTQATCQNILFLGNVHKPEIPFDELADLSLRFLPYLKQEPYLLDMDEEYNIGGSSLGYYDPKYIYHKTGYWGLEIYRLGIVYLMPNGELSPVFNIRGGNNITICANSDGYADSQFTEFPVYIQNDKGEIERNYINYDENTFYTITPDDYNVLHLVSFENVKGVVRFTPTTDTNTVYGIDIRVDNDTIQELKKYVKGYFFVRLTRIPTILAQGVTIGIDQESHTPCVATADGFLNLLSSTLEKTHVETEDINDVNYITEGFLSRYKFKFEKKKSSLFSKIAKAVAIGVAVVAVAALTIYTCGGATALLTVVGTVGGTASIGAASAAGVTAALAGGITSAMIGTAVTSVAIGAAIAGAAAGLALTAAGTILEIRYAVGRTFAKKKLEGRKTLCPSGYKIEEDSESRKITHDFLDRIIIKDPSKVKVLGILCPEYEVNLAKFNSIFTGNIHTIELTNSQCTNSKSGHSSNYFTNDKRHFFIPEYYDMNYRNKYQFKVIGVPDDTQLVGIEKLKFRSRAGSPEEANKYEQVGTERKDNEKQINTDIVRGSFGPYLAFNDVTNKFSPAETVNIYIPKYNLSNMKEYFQIRMLDDTPFYAITDRFDINDIDSKLIKPLSLLVGDTNRSSGYKWDVFRGDCYICQYTHRMHRNFSDPAAPYNHEIVDENSWKENYSVDEVEKQANINLGDINAVLIGTWVTFRVRSSYNLNVRTKDSSVIDEVAMTGHSRASFPINPMSTEGSYKTPDSFFYNLGFAKSVGDRDNKELANVPYIKNWFRTRIVYSDININDAYKNGFRTFRGTAYKDYTREYGEIVKLIPSGSDGGAGLYIVFEHGIGFAPVNEKVVAANAQSGYVHLNVDLVIGDMKVISDTFGSQWPDSVLRIPAPTMGSNGVVHSMSSAYIYGVDTVAKKIWRCSETQVECISDFKVLEFLNNNITLGEREKDPLMGIRNVKTVYNAYKHDVMFTFYDNLNGFEEKVWNLCFNCLLNQFSTFYSWVPSYMENINNIPFSFNRDTSKWIAKLGTSHANNSFANGITLSENIIENHIMEGDEISTDIYVGTKKHKIRYLNKNGIIKEETVFPGCPKNLIGYLNLENKIIPEGEGIEHKFDFKLQRDTFGNYKKFEIKKITDFSLADVKDNDAMYPSISKPIYGLFFAENKDLVYVDEDEETPGVQAALVYTDPNQENEVRVGSKAKFFNVTDLYTEMYYRNIQKNSYSDWENNSNKKAWDSYADSDLRNDTLSRKQLLLNSVLNNYPVYKNRRGQRVVIPRDYQWNPTNIVTQLNISCDISTYFSLHENTSLSEAYYDYIKSKESESSIPESNWINAGYYESVVAIVPRWNMQFLSTDFWKHGQAGLIDIADAIFPTQWYGQQHPFEFEFVVVNDPENHKIFTNLEMIANKAKPESFHYEIVGEAYQFAKDKKNMYFRLEALKALLQYNGQDITYNRNFLEVDPELNPCSAELIHSYYEREDTINEIYDSYIGEAKRTKSDIKNYVYESWLDLTSPTHDYSHLSGGEIVYYPNRQEFRIWQHLPAIDIDDLSLDCDESLHKANCRYLEDRWKVMIAPLLVAYRNEYTGFKYENLYSTWAYANDGLANLSLKKRLPPITIFNTSFPSSWADELEFPDEANEVGRENALYRLYAYDCGIPPYSTSNWLDYDDEYDNDTYGLGIAHNREEADLRDRFIKIRVRYSGEELAVIEMINTMYQISYA